MVEVTETPIKRRNNNKLGNNRLGGKGRDRSEGRAPSSAGRNSTANSNALRVNSSGYVNNNNVTNTNGVRPAFPQSISAEKAQAGDSFKENVASKGKRGFIPFREWRENTWPTARRTPKGFRGERENSPVGRNEKRLYNSGNNRSGGKSRDRSEGRAPSSCWAQLHGEFKRFDRQFVRVRQQQ